MNAPRVIRPHRRLFIGIAALLVLLADYVDFVAGKSIREYYFKDFSASSPSAMHIAVALFAAYLLLVALAGRWLIVSGSKSPR